VARGIATKLYASGTNDGQPCDVGGVHKALHQLHKYCPKGPFQKDAELESFLRTNVFPKHAAAFKGSKLEMAVDGMLVLKYCLPKACKQENLETGWTRPGLYPLSFQKVMSISPGFKLMSAETWQLFDNAVPTGEKLVNDNGLVTDLDMDAMKLPKTQTQLIAEQRPGYT
jgi:hypothetical protein